MVYASIAALYDRIQAFAEAIVSGRFPCVRIALCAAALALVFTSFPNYPNIWNKESEKSADGYWESIRKKRDNLFYDLSRDYRVGSHEGNANFRLTVPLTAKILRLDKYGVVVLQAVCGVLLLWTIARIVLRITGDLLASLFLTCGVASTWAGTTNFTELHGIFDGEALLLLACASLFEGPWLAGLFAFLGDWTDERALIASALVYLYHVCRLERRGAGWRTSYLGATPLAVIGAGVGYLVLRFAVARHFHINTGMSGGLHFLIAQVNNIPMGCWTALEGGWLLVLSAVVILARRRCFLFLLLYTGVISIVLGLAMCVLDITRSMAYALPAVFIALEVLVEVESGPHLRVLCASSSLVSILWPNYYCYSANYHNWVVPLPLRVLQWFSGVRMPRP